ncbi:MAG: glycosyltransferase, partial [Pseudomonadota bacterium]
MTNAIHVTAVVSAYKSQEFLDGRLRNLVEQTLFAKGVLEVIVIDSASPQEEHTIAGKYTSRYPNIRYFRTAERETVYSAWNRGMEMAEGEYLINANTDDRFAVDGLEVLSNSLDNSPDVSCVYGNWLVTATPNDTMESSTSKFVFEYPEFYAPLFLYFQITSHAALVRRSAFEKVGPYNGNLRVFGDREWMLRFCQQGLQAKKVPKVIGLYFANGQGVEATDPQGAAEFAYLRNEYVKPESLSRLFGLSKPLNAKELAQLYTDAGILGKHFYNWNGQSISDLPFAARMFGRALKSDPENVDALNNLGVILATNTKWTEAASLFKAANMLAKGDIKQEIAKNRQRLERRSTRIEDYGWIKSAKLGPLKTLTSKSIPKIWTNAVSEFASQKSASQSKKQYRVPPFVADFSAAPQSSHEVFAQMTSVLEMEPLSID